MNIVFRTHFFRFVAAVAMSLFATTASAAICQFIPASGAWNVPANWANCSTGNGAPVGVPGPADRAEHR